MINGFWECVSLLSISLADDLEDKIKEYNLVLKKSKTKIFDIELKDDCVTFLKKYPKSKGFQDDYPR